MEVRTIKLEWETLDTIFEEIFQEILNKTIECLVDRDDYDYWGVKFVDYQMPIDEIEAVCSFAHATEKDRSDAYPVEDEETVRDFGMRISFKLLSKRLGYSWKKQYVDKDALYLIECTES